MIKTSICSTSLLIKLWIKDKSTFVRREVLSCLIKYLSINNLNNSFLPNFIVLICSQALRFGLIFGKKLYLFSKPDCKDKFIVFLWPYFLSMSKLEHLASLVKSLSWSIRLNPCRPRRHNDVELTSMQREHDVVSTSWAHWDIPARINNVRLVVWSLK